MLIEEGEWRDWRAGGLARRRWLDPRVEPGLEDAFEQWWGRKMSSTRGNWPRRSDFRRGGLRGGRRGRRRRHRERARAEARAPQPPAPRSAERGGQHGRNPARDASRVERSSSGAMSVMESGCGSPRPGEASGGSGGGSFIGGSAGSIPALEVGLGTLNIGGLEAVSYAAAVRRDEQAASEDARRRRQVRAAKRREARCRSARGGGANRVGPPPPVNTAGLRTRGRAPRRGLTTLQGAAARSNAEDAADDGDSVNSRVSPGGVHRVRAKRGAAKATRVGNRFSGAGRPSFVVAFWNQVRSLQTLDHRLQFLQALKVRKWELCGVAGAWKWRNSGSYVMEGSEFVCLWSQNIVDGYARAGVGLFVHRDLLPSLLSWQPVSDRVMVARFAAARKRSISVVVAYAPTGNRTLTERAEFMRVLTHVVSGVPDGDYLVVVGDFNAKVGRARDDVDDGVDAVMGRWSELGVKGVVRNKAGDMLVEACREMGMVIANSYFQHGRWARVSWKGTPPTVEPATIDYVLVRRNQLRSVADVKVVRDHRVNLYYATSDHNAVECTLQLRVTLTKRKAAAATPRLDYGLLLSDSGEDAEYGVLYRKELERGIEGADLEGDDVAAVWDRLVTLMHQAAAAALPLKREPLRYAISGKAKELVEARHARLREANKAATASKTKMPDEVRAELNRMRREIRDELLADQKCHAEACAADLHREARMPMQAEFFKRMAVYTGRSIRSPITSIRMPGVTKVYAGTRSVIVKCFEQHFRAELNPEVQVDEALLEQLRGELSLLEVEQVGQQLRDLSLGEDPDVAFEKMIQQLRDLSLEDNDGEQPGAAPDVMELKEAVRAQAAGKAPDEHGVVAEMVRAACEHDGFVTILHRLVVLTWERRDIPEEFKWACLVPIYKGKSDAKECTNYRGITLLHFFRKIVARIASKPVVKRIEGKLGDEQAGGRRGRGCADHLVSVRALQEDAASARRALCVAFLDLRKAFDSIPRELLFMLLKKEMPDLAVNVSILEALHVGTKCRVKLGRESSDLFDTKGGVQQGSQEGVSLFNFFVHCCLLPIEQELEEIGVKICFKLDDVRHLRLSELREHPELLERIVSRMLFVDDTMVAADTPEALQRGLEVVSKQFEKWGLRINHGKSACMHFNGVEAAPCAQCGEASGRLKDFVMCSSCDRFFHGACLADPPATGSGMEEEQWRCPLCAAGDGASSALTPPIVVGDERIAWVSSYRYLGATFSANCSLDAEISRRIAVAHAAFKTMRFLWRPTRARLGRGTMSQLFNVLVGSVLLYGSEAWALTQSQLDRLQAFQNRCLGRLLKGRDAGADEKYSEVDVPPVAVVLGRRQLRFLGHIGRCDLHARLVANMLAAGRRGGVAGAGRRSLRLAGQRGVYRKLLDSTLTRAARKKHFPDHVNPREFQWYTLVGFKEAWKRFVDESYPELPKL